MKLPPLIKSRLRNSGLITLLALVLSGCGDDWLFIGDPADRLDYDFALGAQGWRAGFADYPAENAESFALQSGIQALPAGFSGTGFLLSGHNRSDDLFMFLTRKISGLSPSTRYQVKLKVSFLSNAGAACAGIGGAPGEGVYLHFGFADIEPKQLGYTLNVAKGNQSQDGAQSKVQGNIAVEGLGCSQLRYQQKIVQSSQQKTLELTTGSDGSVWIFVGTDSAFEGLTTLYYQHIWLEFTPK